MTITTYGDGLHRANEAHIATRSRLWRAGGPLCIQALGYGGTADLYLAAAYDDEPLALAARGFLVAAGDNGNTAADRFGNATSDSAMDDLRTYAGSYYGAATSPVWLLGGSMGGATVLNWARSHTSVVAKIALLIPAVDMEDVRANDRGGFRDEIELAYTNNTTWQATRATRNPVQFASELAAIPIRIWYSTDDPICVSATMTAFAAAHGNTTLTSLGAVGHDATSVDADDLANWLAT